MQILLHEFITALQFLFSLKCIIIRLSDVLGWSPSLSHRILLPNHVKTYSDFSLPSDVIEAALLNIIEAI